MPPLLIQANESVKLKYSAPEELEEGQLIEIAEESDIEGKIQIKDIYFCIDGYSICTFPFKRCSRCVLHPDSCESFLIANLLSFSLWL